MTERDEVTPFNRQRGLDWNPGGASSVQRPGDSSAGPSLSEQLARLLAAEHRPVPSPAPGPSPDESLRSAVR
jgi:hypothetical protein